MRMTDQNLDGKPGGQAGKYGNIGVFHQWTSGIKLT
jgi:hypothetical protein